MPSATCNTKIFIVRKQRVSESSAPGQRPKPAAKPRKFQAIKGVRDLLPAETPLWNHVEQTAHAVFGTFSFSEIRLPICEPTELFARSIGLDTDVVSKEMYSFDDSPSALKDPSIPPDDTFTTIKQKIRTGEINANESQIAKIASQVALFNARLQEGNSTDAQLGWGYF